jgi:hypothetical protein
VALKPTGAQVSEVRGRRITSWSSDGEATRPVALVQLLGGNWHLRTLSSTHSSGIGPVVTIMKSRIMYIECKSGGLTGPGRIGRVTFSKTGKTIYYQGRTFQSLKGAGFKSNFYDVLTGEEYWISGPRKDGADRLYGERDGVDIDPDVRLEYWRDIRGMPERRNDGRT